MRKNIQQYLENRILVNNLKKKQLKKVQDTNAYNMDESQKHDAG